METAGVLVKSAGQKFSSRPEARSSLWHGLWARPFLCVSGVLGGVRVFVVVDPLDDPQAGLHLCFAGLYPLGVPTD